MYLDHAQTWALLFVLLISVLIAVFHALFTNASERVAIDRQSCSDLARAFYQYGVGVKDEDDDYAPVPELRWRCALCTDAAALELELNAKANDGWEVDSITPVPGAGFLLTMNSPRDLITDQDDAYGEPELDETGRCADAECPACVEPFSIANEHEND